MERRLQRGIRHRDVDILRTAIETADLDEARKRITEEELEAARERRDALADQVERCQTLLDRSQTWTGFASEPFRDALSCSLEILGAPPLSEGKDDQGNPMWTFPASRPPGRH